MWGGYLKEVNYCNFDNYIADPIEYRFIDKAWVLPSEKAWGYKLASTQDWYFKMHYPNDPIMPTGFIMESIMQTGVLCETVNKKSNNNLMMFQACNDVNFFDVVRPADILSTYVKMTSFNRGIAKYEGNSYVDDRKVCSMFFSLIVPNEIIRMKK